MCPHKLLNKFEAFFSSVSGCVRGDTAVPFTLKKAALVLFTQTAFSLGTGRIFNGMLADNIQGRNSTSISSECLSQ